MFSFLAIATSVWLASMFSSFRMSRSDMSYFSTCALPLGTRATPVISSPCQSYAQESSEKS